MKTVFRWLVCLGFAFCCCFTSVAQSSSNYVELGVAALKHNEIEEGRKWFLKELQQNPQNGMAYFWMGFIHKDLEEYGKALNYYNKAIQFLPDENKQAISFSYSEISEIHNQMDLPQKALEDINKAIELAPQVPDYRNVRGSLYISLDKIEEAKKEFHDIIAMDSTSTMGYIGLTKCFAIQKNLEEAVKQTTLGLAVNPKDIDCLNWRAICLSQLKRYGEAAQDIIQSATVDISETYVQLLYDMSHLDLPAVSEKLKIQMEKEPENIFWPGVLGVCYEMNKHYKEAIECYKRSVNLEYDILAVRRVYACYEKIGDFENALKEVQETFKHDSLAAEDCFKEAFFYNELGQSKTAVEKMTVLTKDWEELPFCYYWRGVFKENADDPKGAIEDYTKCIDINPNSFVPYQHRGDLYLKQGDKDRALQDFERVVELDTLPKSNSLAPLAYWEMGKKEEAIAFENAILENTAEDEDAEIPYQAALLYARMEDKDKTLHYLEEAMKKGFVLFHTMELEKNFDFIRSSSEFKALLEKYKPKK